MQMSKLSFGRVVTVCGIAGLVVAGALALSMPDRYQSTAILKIPAGLHTSVLMKEAAMVMRTPSGPTTIVKDPNLHLLVPRPLRIEDMLKQMWRSIEVRPAGPGLVEIQILSQEPAAQQLTKLLAAKFDILEVRASPSPAQDTLVRERVILVGLGIGLALGLLMALILRRRTPVAT